MVPYFIEFDDFVASSDNGFSHSSPAPAAGWIFVEAALAKLTNYPPAGIEPNESSCVLVVVPYIRNL
jgi:hypothetical protein